LKDLCEQRTDTLLPAENEHLPYVGLEHIDSGNPVLSRHGYFSEVRSTKTCFQKNEILYGKLRPYLDKAVLADIDGVCSTDILVFRANLNHVIPEFLIHLFHIPEFLTHAINTTSGVNHPRTSWSSLNKLEVPLPPLPEQKAIAEVLRTVQRAKEATEKVIAATRQLKASLMKHLFTYGPVPFDQADKVPLKETEAGWIPEHWEVTTLGSIAAEGGGSIQTGPFGSLLKASSYVAYGIPFVMPKNLTANAKIDRHGIAEISEKDSKRLERYRLKTGDLLVGRRGELGRRGLVTDVEDGWVCGSGCLRVRCGTLLDVLFLSYSFEEKFIREWLSLNAIGTTMANLSTEILSRLPLKVPPVAEQSQIADILQNIDCKQTAEERKAKSQTILFNSLLSRLMTGQLRVGDNVCH